MSRLVDGSRGEQIVSTAMVYLRIPYSDCAPAAAGGPSGYGVRRRRTGAERGQGVRGRRLGAEPARAVRSRPTGAECGSPRAELGAMAFGVLVAPRQSAAASRS